MGPKNQGFVPSKKKIRWSPGIAKLFKSPRSVFALRFVNGLNSILAWRGVLLFFVVYLSIYFMVEIWCIIYLTFDSCLGTSK